MHLKISSYLISGLLLSLSVQNWAGEVLPYSNRPLPYQNSWPGDACQNVIPTTEALELLKLMRFGVDLAYDEYSPELILQATVAYLDDIRTDKRFNEQVRRQVAISREAMCSYYRQRIPVNTHDGVKLAEVLSHKIGSLSLDPLGLWMTAKSPRPGYPRAEEYGGLISQYSVALHMMNHFTLPDQFFINRMALLLNSLFDLMGESSVLEVGAGHGLTAKALQDKGVNILPTDNFSHVVFNNDKVKRTAKKIVRDMEQLRAIESLEEYKIYLALNTFSKMDMISRVIERPGARLLLMSNPFVDGDYEGFKTLDSQIKAAGYGKSVYFDYIDIAVPTIYGPLRLVLFYFDDLDYGDPRWKKNIKKLRKIRKGVEALLSEQIQASPYDSESGLRQEGEL